MLLLLDIDGVMIPAASWKPLVPLADGFPAFMGMAVKNLNRLISKIGATVLLTTSHRAKFSVSEWEAIFKNRGIDVSIALLENNINNLSRKDEVINWYKTRKFYEEDFIIIDDDKSLNDLPGVIKCSLVLTRPLIGFDEEALEEAMVIAAVLYRPAPTSHP